MRGQEIPLLADSRHLHRIGHREVGPVRGLAELKGAMTRVQKHVVLDCLQTPVTHSTNCVSFLVNNLLLCIVEVFNFAE